MSRLSLCGPVMDWQPVQGVPYLSPDDHWDSLQPPRDQTDGLSEYRKWMDGWMDGWTRVLYIMLFASDDKTSVYPILYRFPVFDFTERMLNPFHISLPLIKSCQVK